MITNLRIENFKSWRDTGPLRFAPLTGFFGSNSSGKTSILQLLLLLRQTVESPDRRQVLNLGDERSLVSLGTFQDVLFEHVLQSHLRWGLSWDNFLGREKGETWSFEADVSEQDARRMVVNRFRYTAPWNAWYSMERKPDSLGQYDLKAESQGDKLGIRRTKGEGWDLPPPVKCYGFPDEVKAYYEGAVFLSDLELSFETHMSNLFYLGPLREYPKREYRSAGKEPSDVGYRGESTVDALLAARQEGPRVEQEVARWLKELGLIHDFSVSPVALGSSLYQVKVRQSPRSAEVLLTDVGFGVSQLLPVLVLCYYAPEGSTLIFEQPEIHLHPSVQAGLADVFLDAIRTRKVQILLESHSEYLVKRLQRRIAEDDSLSPEDVALYFCRMEEGESKIEALDVDDEGNIRNWPADFFGNEMEDLAARTRAAMRRKQGTSG
jgi:hypothetical protein